MRILALLCTLATFAVTASVAGAVEPNTGTLSVERGKGVVTVELRGSLLGRLAAGSLKVTDHTPTDRYVAMVAGRRITQERVGPKTVLYRGVGLRFRMLGGGFRVVARGSGISLSAVGRGAVTLDAEPRYAGDDAGVYSLDGVDCSLEPESCTPLPAVAERFVLEPTEERPQP